MLDVDIDIDVDDVSIDDFWTFVYLSVCLGSHLKLNGIYNSVHKIRINCVHTTVWQNNNLWIKYPTGIVRDSIV